MDVAVISYNTRAHLRQCLQSVLAQEPAGQVIVADNGSTDGSQEMVRSEFPGVRLSVDDSNPGYGAAANRAARLSQSEYLLLLNSDTRLPPGSIPALLAFLEQHPRAGIAGPRLVNPNGSLQASCFHFPSPLFSFLQANSLGDLARRLPWLREYYLPGWSHDRTRQVPWVLGAALAIRREAFDQVGGFDEGYFMYSEEVDLCYRMQQAGWQTVYAPVTAVTHIQGASTGKISNMEVYRYIGTRRFYERHYRPWQRHLLSWIVTYSMLRNMARDRLRLFLARGEARRAQYANNLQMWQQILREGR